MSAAMADSTSGMSFFIDQDSDFFTCFEVFLHAFFKKRRKNLIFLAEHIDQIDFFLSMIKKFVVHS